MVRIEEFVWQYCRCLYLFNADPVNFMLNYPAGKKAPLKDFDLLAPG
jgi:hypothetical protein